MTINERIIELRKKNNVSQAKLAQNINVSSGNVSDWERGKSKPGADALVALMNFFNVSSDYLLTGQEPNIIHQFHVNESFIKEDDQPYNSSKVKLSNEEIEMILRHRNGELIILDKNIHMLKGEIGELSDLELDLILKLRNMDQRIQEDFYDNLCWRYEKENHKKISYESKIG